MDRSKQRERYRLIRYAYYHAGRLLHLIGNFHSSGIMLGYAVETTMKAGLMEVLTEEQQNKNPILNKAHDVRKIFAECGRHELFTDVGVSEDFLEHINNHFQRYPSQQRKVLNEAGKQNKVIGNSIDWVYYYDDLIVQLDHHLFKRTSDPSISIIYHAIRTLETRYARDILRENAFALLKFEEYAQMISQNTPEREDYRKQLESNLSKDITFYWNPDSPKVVTYETIVDICKKYSANTFELPKWIISNGYMKAVVP